MVNPLVSIIVPSYNQGEFISRTMDSIINQSYKNFEVIVVDGLSTDNTIDVLLNYSEYITSLTCEKDQGQSDAINKGFAIAKGDIIGWINSDDLLLKDTIASVVEVFMNDDTLGFVYGDIDVIDETDAVRDRYSGKPIFFPSIFWSLDLPIPQQGSFWNRQNLNFNLRISGEYHCVLDRDIFLRTILNARYEYLNMTLGCFRYHDNSKSVSQKLCWIREIPAMYKSIIEDYPNRFTNSEVRKINALPYAYNFFEYLKAKDLYHAIFSLQMAIRLSPTVIFRLDLCRKFRNFLKSRV